jgi:hypothetical protein
MANIIYGLVLALGLFTLFLGLVWYYMKPKNTTRNNSAIGASGISKRFSKYRYTIYWVAFIALLIFLIPTAAYWVNYHDVSAVDPTTPLGAENWEIEGYGNEHIFTGGPLPVYSSTPWIHIDASGKIATLYGGERGAAFNQSMGIHSVYFTIRENIHGPFFLEGFFFNQERGGEDPYHPSLFWDYTSHPDLNNSLEIQVGKNFLKIIDNAHADKDPYMEYFASGINIAGDDILRKQKIHVPPGKVVVISKQDIG